MMKKTSLLILSLIYIIVIVYYYGFNMLTYSYVTLYSMLLLLTIDDLRNKLIPLDLIICFGIFSVILLPFNPSVSLIWTIIITLITVIILYIVHLLTHGGIGLGDVWVIGISMLILGWQNGLTLLMVSLLCSGLLSILLLIMGKVNRKAKIPFIPFMLGGFIILTLI
ncbi:prepilin peptidase [Vallitalea okinawensis]|uniref:prepilin peptidase n=1 Tax=Vallitalea okinawensis TaxID=2078660 RepID=UPI000CFD6DA2|nr:prepilin peptidase [Vallitalea okinawensis]